MAQRLLLLRRTLRPLYSTLHRPFSNPISIVPPAAQTPPIISQWRGFMGTRVSMMSMTGRPEKQYKLYRDGDEITENTILFEGCDYNHWLVTVDFPKEQPKPSPEEMVATYERICAQGLNISIEEAKTRIYACSTTTYQGFQVLMTEEESEKFTDVPGVVFVLPDSYIDPANKEYGGDKYENGVITPRPPPVLRGGERRRERSRIPPRFHQQGGPVPNHQGPPPQYSQQGHTQGDPIPNHQGPPPQYSQQGHTQGGPIPNHQGPPPQYSQQGHTQGGPIPNHQGPPPQCSQQGHTQGGPIPNHQGLPPQYSQQGQMQGGPIPNHQEPPPQYSQQGRMQGGASNYGPQQNYPPQQNHGPPGPGGRMPINNRDYAPGGRNTYPGQQGNHYTPGQQGYNQGQNQYPPEQQGYGQGQEGNHYTPDQRSFPQGDRRDHGSAGQRDYRGDNRNYSPSHGGNYEQGGNTGYGQTSPRWRSDQGGY